MNTNPQAKALNGVLQRENPAVLALLSERGRAIYFPRQGILSQSAEARGRPIDATIGIALEEDGSPMCLSSLARQATVPSGQLVSYTPSSGRPDLRRLWQHMLYRKNPGLAGAPVSLPVVTSALTHGLNLCGYLFCEAGDTLVLADLFWENYELVFERAYGVRLDPFPMFTPAGGFNLDALRSRLRAGSPRARLLLLNFPNNPAGYTPTQDECQVLAGVLREAAGRGPLLVLIDDAYFGLVYRRGIYAESVFSLLCGLHPNLLAVKLDGPTKEDYAWGFRIGFLTFGVRGGTPALYEALEAKTAGAIRGMISNASAPAQALLMGAYADPSYDADKREKFDRLRARYEAVVKILAEHPEYAEAFEALPFNSGYFMCARLRHADPERVRRRLLDRYGTGVIVMRGVIRMAFSAVPLRLLPTLFDNLYRAAREEERADPAWPPPGELRSGPDAAT